MKRLKSQWTKLGNMLQELPTISLRILSSKLAIITNAISSDSVTVKDEVSLLSNELRSAEYSEEALTLLAKAIVPDVIEFYNSEFGKRYFEEWLKAHPEYQDGKRIA